MGENSKVRRRTHSRRYWTPSYAGLRPDEMRQQLDDFCRRRVFHEEERQYAPTVELFGRWLRNGGFNLLVDGHLGDELEERRQVEKTRYMLSRMK